MFLIVGGDSEVGKAAAPVLRRHDRTLVTTRRADVGADDCITLDLAGDLTNWEPPAGVTAACICAAVARLADCENDPARSARVNVTGTLALAERLLARDVFVLFLSTNQVFDGATPHVRADAPMAPVSEYGQQKARTEAALRVHMARGAPVAILRLSKVVSAQSKPLSDWMAALAAGKTIHPPAFRDMTFAPTPIDTVARAIATLMSEQASGVFQLTGPRDVTYADAARFIAERLGADPSLAVTGTVADAPLAAGAAPPHTTLESGALRERYGITVADAWDVLDAVSRAVAR